MADGLRKFVPYVGKYRHETLQIRYGGSRLEEEGEARIYFDLDSTYVVIDVSLQSSDNQTRSYIQYITYDQRSNEFISRYYFSGTTVTIEERGLLIQPATHWN